MSHSSVVGGSTASRVLACPGSIDLCRKMPPDKGSIYAEIGSACHEVMEAWLLGKPELQHELVTPHIRENKIEPAKRWFLDMFAEHAEFHVERSVNFGNLIVDLVTGEKAFGTADVIFRHDNGEAGIVDWKFGDGHLVSAERNIQMCFYLAAAVQCGYLPKQMYYSAYIFQPSMKLAPDAYASRGVYNMYELDTFTQALSIAVTTLPRPFAVGKHCHWCKAKTICDTYLDAEFGDARLLLQSKGK